MSLDDLVAGFLEAEGWQVRPGGRDLFVGTRSSFGDSEEFICVWVPTLEGERGLGAREGIYHPQFKDAGERYPGAQKFMVVDSTQGLSAEFVKGSRRWYNVRILVPAQFFDTAFRWEESREVGSALQRLRQEGEQRIGQRIPQPFTMTSGEGGKICSPLCMASYQQGHQANQSAWSLVLRQSERAISSRRCSRNSMSRFGPTSWSRSSALAPCLFYPNIWLWQTRRE